ncbi:hypothetical protein BJX62DRAFT_241844 [Aspergillus germanicus]
MEIVADMYAQLRDDGFNAIQDLTPTQKAILLVGVLLLVGTISSVISGARSWNRLWHFNGPFSAAFSYFYLAKISVSGKPFETLMDVHRKYGRLVRIGPNELMTDDPELIKAMGSTTSNWARSTWYNSGRVHPKDDTILNVVDTATHDKLRHDLIPGYSGRDNRSLEGDIDGQLVKLIDLIRSKYISTKDKTRPLEFVKLSQYFTKIVVWGEITANVPLTQFLLSWSFIFDTLAYPLAREIYKFNTLAERIVANRFKQVGGPVKSQKLDQHGDMLVRITNPASSTM